ncbi:hypothetical protein [Tritonibacter mobilis]|uniref:hypothetical protein n=1 Tax=Tritonibacter mobilis TaxID=379347 RepID=UPI000806B626|nr:hypothetical protein [Tritonibacter mobilis]GLP88095.1 hypothetical protein GCM10007921_36560 [Tritonibacter mobilis]SDX27790.1 hypothetical protein SAMN05444385_10685 [Tritonibacter mobilis]
MKSVAHQYTQKLLKLAYSALFSWFELIVGWAVTVYIGFGELLNYPSRTAKALVVPSSVECAVARLRRAVSWGLM